MNIRRLTGKSFILIIVVLVNLLVWQNRQAIADWFALRGYDPPATIQALANETSLTESAQHLFYINRPELDDKTAFNRNCGDHSEQTIVLGCYHGDRQGIFIYDVQDPRLRGVEEVTAVHEMLHQAYDRLSAGEKRWLIGELESFYQQNSDQRLHEKIENYRRAGADIPNELHSIYGSEVQELPPVLENYYKRYFHDRQKVVGFSRAYQDEFVRRETAVRDYDTKLTALKTEIEQNRQTLEQRSRELKQLEARLNQTKAGGDAVAYNTLAENYNSRVNSYNALLGATRQLIGEYNSIVTDRNNVAFEEKQLQQALDSHLGTSPAAN